MGQWAGVRPEKSEIGAIAGNGGGTVRRDGRAAGRWVLMPVVACREQSPASQRIPFPAPEPGGQLPLRQRNSPQAAAAPAIDGTRCGARALSG